MRERYRQNALIALEQAARAGPGNTAACETFLEDALRYMALALDEEGSVEDAARQRPSA